MAGRPAVPIPTAAIVPPATLAQCALDRSSAFYITKDNWYWSQTVDAYLEHHFRSPVQPTQGTVAPACQFQVIKSDLVYHHFKEEDEATASGDASRVADCQARKQNTFAGFYNRVLNGNEKLVIPINTGGHWVLAIMKKGADNRVKLYYFDPLGDPMGDRYRDSFRCNPPLDIDFIESTRPVQIEDRKVHCGPYILEAAEMFAEALVSRDLDLAGMDGILADMNQGVHTPDSIRLKHAQRIYVLARADESMNVSTSIVQNFNQREFDHLKELFRAGGLDPCMKHIRSNKDWLACKKSDDSYRNEHCDSTGAVLVVETKLDNGKKTFHINDKVGDYVIRIPALNREGKLYKIAGEVQYDILVFEKGKLASCLIYKNSGAIGACSQICPKWLEAQKSSNRADDFVDFDDHSKPKSLLRTPTRAEAGGGVPGVHGVRGGGGVSPMHSGSGEASRSSGDKGHWVSRVLSARSTGTAQGIA